MEAVCYRFAYKGDLMKIKLALPVLMTLVSLQAFAAKAPAGAYQIDLNHSNIGFEVGHLGGISLVVGRFDKFTGNIQFTPGGESHTTVEVDMASINTKVDQRDKHLRSNTFFDVANFPTMKFESVKVEYDADGNPISIHGNLTLHGQTRTLILTVIPIGGGQASTGETRAGFKATGVVKRSEFGMNQLLPVVADEVTVILNVEAAQP